ncbi:MULTISPECIES: hypothetical protein [unclassified Fibrobacter]|uniref:hypothetical protein n=1 Tax=unclassified Fibrobacter TaxID=2634177 RepID=UPI000D794483|nr:MULTISPECIES: hypothetical protein [unclassified Fibrobacter]PWJ71943.1 hypothetical protein BGX12_101182 [Fibrobacter sp. UWR4]PZW70393.1 hypothetical protein C8E88_101250 [Fibrobacter sp. UWR1]
MIIKMNYDTIYVSDYKSPDQICAQASRIVKNIGCRIERDFFSNISDIISNFISTLVFPMLGFSWFKVSLESLIQSNKEYVESMNMEFRRLENGRLDHVHFYTEGFIDYVPKDDEIRADPLAYVEHHSKVIRNFALSLIS